MLLPNVSFDQHTISQHPAVNKLASDVLVQDIASVNVDSTVKRIRQIDYRFLGVRTISFSRIVRSLFIN